MHTTLQVHALGDKKEFFCIAPYWSFLRTFKDYFLILDLLSVSKHFQKHFNWHFKKHYWEFRTLLHCSAALGLLSEKTLLVRRRQPKLKCIFACVRAFAFMNWTHIYALIWIRALGLLSEKTLLVGWRQPKLKWIFCLRFISHVMRWFLVELEIDWAWKGETKY